jgi:hypothetical protein
MVDTNTHVRRTVKKAGAGRHHQAEGIPVVADYPLPSVTAPVYNGPSTVAGVIRRVRAADLADGHRGRR